MLGAAWRVLRDAGQAWQGDRASSMGAALAFYTLFSISPLLLIVISVAGLVFGEAAARAEIVSQVTLLLGRESAATVESLLQGLNRPTAGVIGTLVGLGALVVGATTVFAELQDAMDRIWRAPPLAGGGGLWRLLRTRLLSLGLVMGIGFLLMVSLIMSAALAALGTWWAPWFGAAVVGQAVTALVSFVLITAVFAMIYKWMPRVQLAWRDVWTGAALTSLLFTVGKTAIGIYIGSSGVASPFGAAASLVVLLLWVYYSALIFLFGAELSWVYAHRHGSLRHRAVAPSPQTPKPAVPAA